MKLVIEIDKDKNDRLDYLDVITLKEIIRNGKPLEKESCEDAVSRQTVKEQMIYYGFHAPDMTVTEFVEDCLPSVTPHQATCDEREKGECPFYAG